MCLTDLELIRYVAVNGHKFHRPEFVKQQIPSIGNGLFSSNGKAHARQKRMIGPAFTTKNLKGFSKIFKENVENLVKVNFIIIHWNLISTVSQRGGDTCYWGCHIFILLVHIKTQHNTY